MTKSNSINWIEARNKILIETPYNEIMRKKLNDHGFYYEKESEKYAKSFSDEDIPFLLSFGDGFKKKEGFQALMRAKLSLIEALNCHTQKETIDIQSPMLKRELMPHQLILLKFIRSNKGKCIAGDEQGVGKTYPPLVYSYEENIPTLIICPPDLIENWKQEIRNLFFEDDLIGRLFRVVGYDSHKDIDENSKWAQSLIIDEAHNLSDLKSKRHQKAFSVAKNLEKVILITGNSVKYWPIEFYSMLKLLGKDLTKDRYVKRFFHTMFENNRLITIGLKAQKLKFYIAPFYLRRKLSDIARDLKGENLVHTVKLSPEELKVYDKALKSRGVILSGGAVVNLNKTVSLLKFGHLVKYIKILLKENPKKKIVVCSQFKEIFEGLRAEFNFCTSYPVKSQLLFLNTSEHKEGFSLGEYDLILMLDVFANKNHNIQIKRRFLRLGQESERVLCVYFLAGLIDQELLSMPEILNYQKSIEYIDKYLRAA